MRKTVNALLLTLLLCVSVFCLEGCGRRKLNAETEAWLYTDEGASPSAPAETPGVWTPAPSPLPTAVPASAVALEPSAVPAAAAAPAAAPGLSDFASTASLQGWVNGDDVNFRRLPGIEGEVITSFDRGRELTILGFQNGWTKVVIDGETGYIKSEYVTQTRPAESSDPVHVYQDSSVTAGSGATDLDRIRDRIIRLTNEQRSAYGLPALTYDSGLQSAADIRASEQTVLFSHTRPDGSDWSTAFPSSVYCFLGENLASCDTVLSEDSFSSSCVKWWMESEDHRSNILNSYYTVTAVGVVVSGGSMYAVQEFGTPY